MFPSASPSLRLSLLCFLFRLIPAHPTRGGLVTVPSAEQKILTLSVLYSIVTSELTGTR